MTRMWNYDKPHRCPECHYIWTAQVPVWEYDTLDGVTPRWWKTYTCRNCGTTFTGRWAWWPKYTRHLKWKIGYYVREAQLWLKR